MRIAGREVLADIALAQRAEDGVGQGVQRHIGVGMPGQRLGVRDRHAAKDDVIASAEAMNVEAVADARFTAKGIAFLGARQVATAASSVSA